jgi:2'-5' RNA ligase
MEARGLRARYERPEKLHVTLAFLGSVEAGAVERVTDVLRETAAQTDPFALSLDKIGAFPHKRNPHVVYIGAHKAGPPFRELARRVRAAYAQLGFAFGEEAVAHVTIARVKEAHQHLPAVEFAPIPVNVRELTLFRSVPAVKTSHFEILERAQLRVSASG